METTFTKPPILIGGCGRSGTTLMLGILSAHANIFAIPYETEAFCPGAYSGRVDLNEAFDLQRIETCLKTADRDLEQTRWCEKTPKNIQFVRPILERFGSDIQIINMVRDGRDVVTSRHPLRDRHNFWITPERWVADVSAGLPYDRHPQVCVVRYEDLVTDFSSTIQRICDFLEEPCLPEILTWHKHARLRNHPAWEGEVKPLYENSINRWQNTQYEKHICRFMSTPRVETLLRHYGYLE